MTDTADYLEIVPTADLIAELKRRTSFQGLIVYRENQTRGEEWAEGEAQGFVLDRFNITVDEAVVAGTEMLQEMVLAEDRDTLPADTGL